MQKSRLTSLCILAISSFYLHGQIQISKFVPGDFRFSNVHRVELINTSSKTVDIGHFLLVTRDYSLRIPKSTTLKPQQKFIVGLKNTYYNPDLDLKKCKDFLFKPYKKTIEGNYVALFSPHLSFLEGFYFTQLREAPFLPEKSSLILANGDIIHYEVPSYNHPKWKYLLMNEDPAIAFEQFHNEWRITSIYPDKKFYAQIQFQSFDYRFLNNLVNFQVITSIEENIQAFLLQRMGKDGFETIESFQPTNSPSGSIYKWVDAHAMPDQTYYYRIAAKDIFGAWFYSKVIEVDTHSKPNTFWYEILPQKPTPQQDIDLRFYSTHSKKLKIKLLDNNMREIAVLFHNYVYANQQNLIRIKKLPWGKYWLIFQDDMQRTFTQLTVE